MNLQNAIDAVRVAFQKVIRDNNGPSLHQADLISMSEDVDPADWARANSIDSEVRWQDIPASSLDECDPNDILSHSSPQGWRFYLPAYMCRILATLNTNEFQDESLTGVLHSLKHEPDSSIDDYKLERFETLDLPQQNAVKAFLQTIEEYFLDLIGKTNQYYDAYNSARETLAMYWGLPVHERPVRKAAP